MPAYSTRPAVGCRLRGAIHAGAPGVPVLVRILVLAVLLGPFASWAQPFEGLLQTKRSALNVLTAIQQPGVLEPVARLSIRRLFVERQKRGVFRVALLPKLVFEGATFDVREASALGVCMRQMSDALRNRERSRVVEFRGLKLQLSGEAGWTVEAESGEPASATVWVLRQPVWRRAGLVVFAAFEAHLVTRPDGALVLHDPSGLRPDAELGRTATASAPPISPRPPSSL